MNASEPVSFLAKDEQTLSAFPPWIESSFYFNIRLLRPTGLLPDHLRHIWAHELCEGERTALLCIPPSRHFEAACILAAGTETFGIHPEFQNERMVARACMSSAMSISCVPGRWGAVRAAIIASPIGAAVIPATATPFVHASLFAGGAGRFDEAAALVAISCLCALGAIACSSWRLRMAAFSWAWSKGFSRRLVLAWKASNASIRSAGIPLGALLPCKLGPAVAARNPGFARRLSKKAQTAVESAVSSAGERARRLRDESLAHTFLRSVYDRDGLRAHLGAMPEAPAEQRAKSL